MRKIIIIQVIILTALIMCVCYLGGEFVDSLKERQEHIGDTTVLNGDTLLIIDYTPFNDTYMLSNGVKVSTKLIIK